MSIEMPERHHLQLNPAAGVLANHSHSRLRPHGTDPQLLFPILDGGREHCFLLSLPQHEPSLNTVMTRQG